MIVIVAIEIFFTFCVFGRNEVNPHQCSYVYIKNKKQPFLKNQGCFLACSKTYFDKSFLSKTGFLVVILSGFIFITFNILNRLLTVHKETRRLF